jgi:soluble cytochrome b562
VIEIGGDVRASQIISDNPMTNAGSGENDSIFLTVGIIVGVLALGYVVFRKYFKIGLVRTNSSKDSNRSVKSMKHVKKSMKSSHFGIFVLVSLSLLFTVPSAFADVAEDNPAIQNSASNSNAAFKLMNLITNGQNEAATLSTVIENNGLNQSLLDDFTDALDEAAALSAAGDLEGAQAALDEADALLDDVYDEIYDEVDSQQSTRYDIFVNDAITSLTFLVENGATLGLTDVVIDELKNTLAILEGGDYDEIIAATSETSNTGLTFSMFPGLDNASPTAKDPDEGKAQGKGVGLADDIKLHPAFDNLPDKFKQKFGISTEPAPGTLSVDGSGEETNGFFEGLDGWKAALDNGLGLFNENNPALEKGQGIGLGKTPWIFEYGFSPDDGFGSPFGDDFWEKFGSDRGREYGMKMKAEGQKKAAEGQAQGEESSGGNGQGQGGPPCGSPPCGGPPGGGPPGGGPPGGP